MREEWKMTAHTETISTKMNILSNRLLKEGQEFKGVTGSPENERRVADYPEEHTDHGRRGSGSFIVIHIGKNMKVGEEFKR